MLLFAPQVIFHTGRWSPCGRSLERWGRGIWCDCAVANSWKVIIEAASTSLSTDRRQTCWSFPSLRPCPLIHCGPCWDTLLRSVHTTGSDEKHSFPEIHSRKHIVYDQQGAAVVCGSSHDLLGIKNAAKMDLVENQNSSVGDNTNPTAVSVIWK